ncbi:MAG: transglutaminase domain-containing protein [Phycisphaerales bacterium]|nr:transglutaminase domain-containing protein [Phycisphaerales bacterium]
MFIWIPMMIGFVVGGEAFQKQLDLAAENRHEIELAIRTVPANQKEGMAWLLTHMPEEDLKTLTGEFLLQNCNLAYEAWQNAPWKDQVSKELFFDCILPYSNVNERREDWRSDFHARFSEIVKDATTPTEAAILLNQSLYDMVDVHYSTQRPKADQSPFESIEAGMASCSGLSILLIDACRSVGVPARFTGTPLWYNESGNHSWIEFWDQGWHYTEANTSEVDKAWFDDSASKATKGHPQHAIFAVTWEESSQHFPLVWLPDVTTYGAVDVTDRYTNKHITEDVRVRIRIRDKDGSRIAQEVIVSNDQGEVVFEGISKDERADANDHLTFMCPQGETYTFQTKSESITKRIDTELIIDFYGGLTEFEAFSAADLAWHERKPTLTEQLIEHDGYRMPFWYRVFGDAPRGKKSLWISLHGGGGAPPEVNTQQWNNQKELYTLEEGVYVVPRAPTDTWNMWHQSHIDPMLDKLITHMVLSEGVNPNKVYLLGYSAGGDGVYQLAPRMSDRFAAAAMMAGHPNETVPEGLRNLPFALHVGAEDSAYSRNAIALQWKAQLGALHKSDPKGYKHQALVHEGLGHWMHCKETVSFPWMATFERNPYPKKVVWVQDDVLHDKLYWLGVDEPVARSTIVASVDDQTITIHHSDVKKITIYLHDLLLDLDQPVVVQYKDQLLGTFKVVRDCSVIYKTLHHPTNYYSASITIDLPLDVELQK